MNIAIIGGTWDSRGGRESGLVRRLYHSFFKRDCDISRVWNGGFYSKLEYILKHLILNNL